MKKVTLIALMAILCLSGMAQKKKGTVRKTVSKNIFYQKSIWETNEKKEGT